MKSRVITFILCALPGVILASKAVLLVSLGMPDLSLKQYIKQAHQYRIPVVIRGLYKQEDYKEVISGDKYIGSFKDTATRIKNLIGPKGQGGLSINPLVFRAFAIQAVPTLVVYDDSLSCIRESAHSIYKHCELSSYDVVYGNAPLTKLLNIITDKSASTDRAKYAYMLLGSKKIRRSGV